MTSRPLLGESGRGGTRLRHVLTNRESTSSASERFRHLDRSSKMFQSAGRLNIRRIGPTWWVYLKDPFHSLLHLELWKLLILTFCMYMTGFLVFTPFYYAARGHCGVDWDTWTGAFLFSCETMMTIGYGASDPAFRSCTSLAILISVQSIAGTILDAVCIGVVYDRLSRTTTRANSILFSNKASIMKYDGKWAFQFRVIEARKHQLTEAHVRLLIIYHVVGADGSVEVKTRPVQIHEPDEDIGGMLFLAYPQAVSHFVNARQAGIHEAASPLLPSISFLAKTASTPLQRELTSTSLSAGTSDRPEGATSHGFAPPVRLNMDRLTGSELGGAGAGAGAGVAGGEADGGASSFGAGYQEASPADSSPTMDPDSLITVSGQSVLATVGDYGVTWPLLEQYWREAQVEVLVIVEGIDAVTSDTCQARHSYSIDDVVFNQPFRPCATRGPNGTTIIDLEKFHEMMLPR